MMEEEKQAQGMPEEERHLTSRDIDILYRETDRLYYELARGCGLSDTAYWMLYEVVFEGGSCAQRNLGQDLCCSRQTVNSALKSLEARGLIELGFEEGSRKCKVVRLTPAGEEFCAAKVQPAMQAEDRAFQSLTPADQKELVRLVGHYAEAIDQELARLRRGSEEEGRGEGEA